MGLRLRILTPWSHQAALCNPAGMILFPSVCHTAFYPIVWVLLFCWLEQMIISSCVTALRNIPVSELIQLALCRSVQLQWKSFHGIWWNFDPWETSATDIQETHILMCRHTFRHIQLHRFSSPLPQSSKMGAWRRQTRDSCLLRCTARRNNSVSDHKHLSTTQRNH